MHITGESSYAGYLEWFEDLSTTFTLPTPQLFSLPLWVFRLLALGWAIWLAFAVTQWCRSALKLVFTKQNEQS